MFEVDVETFELNEFLGKQNADAELLVIHFAPLP